MLNTTIKILLIIFFTSNSLLAAGFYNRGKEGWYWYEQKKTEENKIIKTPDQARKELDKYVQELDDARALMVVDPTVENIKNYKEKEMVMWKRMIRATKNASKANFQYPNLFDRNKNPVNVHAVRVKRDIQDQNEKGKIQRLAAAFNMVIFRNGNCSYSKGFEPVLFDFAQEYGFEVEAVNIDNSQSEYFPNRNVPELVKKLGIDSTPIVYLVKKKGQKILEFSRGYLAGKELENTAVIAYDLWEEGKL